MDSQQWGRDALGPAVKTPSIRGRTTLARRQTKPIGSRVTLTAVAHSPLAPMASNAAPATTRLSGP
jgi:hypothetical protein